MTKDRAIKVKERLFKENTETLNQFVGKTIVDVGIVESFSCLEVHFEDGTHFRVDGWNYEREDNEELLISANV